MLSSALSQRFRSLTGGDPLAASAAMIAVLFVIAAVLANAVPGLRFSAGPFSVSLGDGNRVAFQAALATLFAVVARPEFRRKRLASTAAVVAVLVTATADSSPRRVGDGAEYMVMALAIKNGEGVRLSSSALGDIGHGLAATSGWEAVDLSPPFGLRTLDGDVVLPHFWLYSLLVAPAVSFTELAAINPTYAFAFVNIGLLAVLAWQVSIHGQHALAATLCAGPIVWWADKAHSEVFMFVSIAAAVLLADKRPVLASLWGALAVAQNPASCGVLLVPATATIAHFGWRWRSAAILCATVVAAALNPLYYFLAHLSAAPLLGGNGIAVPSLRALLAPVLDTDLGLAIYAPAYLGAVGLGLSAARPRYLGLAGVAAALLLLLAFAQTHNVNHGGTPGMSRYALWLMAVAAPMAAVGLGVLPRKAAAIVVAATLATTWLAFRPALGEQAGPNWLASAVWDRWPSMDDPLPEVFSERISRTDGLAPVPVATPTCSKVLTRGDGRNAVFPFPCTPRRAPDDCSRKDALCYANNGAFVMAPKQIGFGWDAVDEYSWTIESAARLESLLKVLGENPRAVPLASSTRISGGEWLHTLRIAEGKDASVAWIQPREGKVASVDIALRRPSRVVLTDSGGVEVLGQWEVAAGERTLPIPSNRRTRLLVVDEPH